MSIRTHAPAAIPEAVRARMERIVARYYRDPGSGLAEELRFGNVVYVSHGGSGEPGAFLIVNMDHHRAVIGARSHRFTYLGLGCADGHPMRPVFQRVREDLRALMARGEVGILHLTTRTPHAIRGMERAFPGAVAPRPATDSTDELAVAAHVKATIHRHPEREPGESPFVLRQLKKGRFTAPEVARIRASQDDTALTRFGIDCEGADEIIVFHRFDDTLPQAESR